MEFCRLLFAAANTLVCARARWRETCRSTPVALLVPLGCDPPGHFPRRQLLGPLSFQILTSVLADGATRSGDESDKFGKGFVMDERSRGGFSILSKDQHASVFRELARVMRGGLGLVNRDLTSLQVQFSGEL